MSVGVNVTESTCPLPAFITVPASGVGWWLGRRARRAGSQRGLASAAEIIGFLGVLFGLLALVFWIGIISSVNEGGVD